MLLKLLLQIIKVKKIKIKIFLIRNVERIFFFQHFIINYNIFIVLFGYFMDYFTLFNLPKKYRINKSLLSKNFYKLQLKFHPDLFINHSEFEKKIVLQKSIKINKGYKILQDSLTRGMYLLSLNGFKVSKEKFLSEDKNFLKKYFFLYEELNFLTENNCDEVQINTFFKKIEKKIKNYEQIIEIKFNEKKWDDVIKLITELLFFKKIQTRLKK